MTARVPASFMTSKKLGRFPKSAAEFRTFDGITFDSKIEMMRFAELRQREKAGMICELTRQPEYRVSINAIHVMTYTADFKYRDPETGEWTVEDVKSRGAGGTADAAFRIRKRCVEAFFGVEISVVTR
jgi:hypothetical protein